MMAIAATTPAGLDAERLIGRLGPMLDAPATIVWEPGLRASRGLNGYTRPTAPEQLHVDPSGVDVIETAAHEWIHSLELRGLLPTFRTGLVPDTRCTVLARRLAPLIAAAARGAIDLATPREELVLLVFRHTGRLPSGYQRTRRGQR